MREVRVIAPMGAVVRGPGKIRLSREQWARRAHILGPCPKKGGTFDLAAESVQFKHGETFGWDSPAKLHRGLFEVTGDAGAEAAAGDADPAP